MQPLPHPKAAPSPIGAPPLPGLPWAPLPHTHRPPPSLAPLPPRPPRPPLPYRPPGTYWPPWRRRGLLLGRLRNSGPGRASSPPAAVVVSPPHAAPAASLDDFGSFRRPSGIFGGPRAFPRGATVRTGSRFVGGEELPGGHAPSPCPAETRSENVELKQPRSRSRLRFGYFRQRSEEAEAGLSGLVRTTSVFSDGAEFNSFLPKPWSGRNYCTWKLLHVGIMRFPPPSLYIIKEHSKLNTLNILKYN